MAKNTVVKVDRQFYLLCQLYYSYSSVVNAFRMKIKKALNRIIHKLSSKCLPVVCRFTKSIQEIMGFSIYEVNLMQ